MGYYCTVPQCTSLAGKTKNVKFHRFPRDVTMADRWNLILKRGKPYTKYSKVCSLHFTQADYNVTAMGQWKTLSKDAVPSQNLPKLNPDGTVMVIRKSRTIRFKDGARESVSDKRERDSKWALESESGGGLSGPPAAEGAPAEPVSYTTYRTMNAMSNSLSPSQQLNHNQMTAGQLKPKKQDAFMQTDPITSEEEDTSQPNNSYSETSETSYNSTSEQMDYSYKNPKEYSVQNTSPYSDPVQNSTYKDPKEYPIDNSPYKEQSLQTNTSYKDDKSYQIQNENTNYKQTDNYSAFKDPKEYSQNNLAYKDPKEYSLQNNLVYKDGKEYQMQNPAYKDVKQYNMQSQNSPIYKDQKDYAQNNTIYKDQKDYAQNNAIYKDPKNYSIENQICNYKDSLENNEKKYLVKDYSKTDDYIPRTNEEYNKEAEKYALERKSHKIDSNMQRNNYEKIDNNENPYEKIENQNFQKPLLENGYQKMADLYGDFQNRNEYQIGYQNGYSDSAELLRSQQHNIQVLQEQHRIMENQNFFNDSPIKQEVDVNDDRGDPMFISSSGDRNVMHQQRLLEHLHHQVKREPDVAGGDSVILPQESAFYPTNGHTNATGPGGYYEPLPRPGPELLIAKQNALAAHTQLWQNSLKRPFFYGESAHYSSPLLTRYSTEDLTRILQ